MIDTLRVLVSWTCNLKCSYCCNEQERFRKDIHPTTLDAINWNAYKVFCISGGEPLMFMPKIREVCNRIPADTLKILYTNGIFLGARVADILVELGIQAVNVGLHEPKSYRRIIENVTKATAGKELSVRFHAQDIHMDWLTTEFPDVSFRFWKMNDCDRDNEHRVVLS